MAAQALRELRVRLFVGRRHLTSTRRGVGRLVYAPGREPTVSTETIKVAIIGGTGYGGAELIRPPARNPTIWQNLLTCWQMLARFRLYRRQLLKVNMHVAAFF